MLDTLPPSVIKIIAGHLAAVPRYENNAASNPWQTGPAHNLTPGEPSYTRYRTWNDMGQPMHLVHLAHTNRRLKSLVYPVLFETVVCYNPFDQDAGFQIDLYFNYAFHPGPVYMDGYNSVLNGLSVPRFHLTAGYTVLSRDALQHVQCLYMAPGEVQYKPWLARLLPAMTSLQEVKLYLPLLFDFDNVSYVIEQLRNHQTRLRVHVYLGLALGTNKGLAAMFFALEYEWAQLKDLNIESLLVEFGCKSNWYPESFFRLLAGFTTLKQLSVTCLPENDLYFDLDDAVEGYTMGHVLELSKNLPNLESLTVDVGRNQFSWPLGSAITKLSAPTWVFQSSTTFEMLDSVTHLEIQNKGMNLHIAPLVRNLKTLALHEFSGVNGIALLEHCVAHNPKLVNLHLNTCDMPMDADVLSRLFSNIERLELVITQLDFKAVLLSAPNLRRFFFYPDAVGPAASSNDLPLAWLVGAALQHQISQNLDQIEVQPLYVLPAQRRYPSGAEWARDLVASRLSTELAKNVFVPVFRYKERDDKAFVIDLKYLWRHSR